MIRCVFDTDMILLKSQYQLKYQSMNYIKTSFIFNRRNKLKNNGKGSLELCATIGGKRKFKYTGIDLFPNCDILTLSSPELTDSEESNDFDIVLNDFKDKSVEADNLLSKLGAFIGDLFIKETFGVSSIIIIIFSCHKCRSIEANYKTRMTSKLCE